MDCAMMNMEGMGWMMWAMGLGGLLLTAILLLTAAALIKYLFFDRRSTRQ